MNLETCYRYIGHEAFPMFDYRISNVYHVYPIYYNAVDLITFYGVSTKQFMLSNDILLFCQRCAT